MRHPPVEAIFAGSSPGGALVPRRIAGDKGYSCVFLVFSKGCLQLVRKQLYTKVEN